MSSHTTPEVIAQIRAEMARQSVSQTELAPQVGISLRALRSRFGRESPLLVDELVAIADALGVRTSVLFARAEEAEPPAGVPAGGSQPVPAQRRKRS